MKRRLRKGVDEVVGLFVEDGALAAALLIWLTLCALILPRVAFAQMWRAPLLAFGCALILGASVHRGARQFRRTIASDEPPGEKPGITDRQPLKCGSDRTNVGGFR